VLYWYEVVLKGAQCFPKEIQMADKGKDKKKKGDKGKKKEKK
jgi:hypothetical protein